MCMVCKLYFKKIGYIKSTQNWWTCTIRNYKVNINRSHTICLIRFNENSFTVLYCCSCSKILRHTSTHDPQLYKFTSFYATSNTSHTYRNNLCHLMRTSMQRTNNQQPFNVYRTASIISPLCVFNLLWRNSHRPCFVLTHKCVNNCKQHIIYVA